MPTIYGEGRRAFRRLQLEIIKTTNDHTIFAWQDSECDGDMLASSPSQFQGCQYLRSVGHDTYAARFRVPDPKPDFAMTNAGLHIQLAMFPLVSKANLGLAYSAVLACVDRRTEGSYVRIFLQRSGADGVTSFHRIAVEGCTSRASTITVIGCLHETIRISRDTSAQDPSVESHPQQTQHVAKSSSPSLNVRKWIQRKQMKQENVE